MSVLRFNRALVRRPGRSVVDGLRAVDRGAPDYDDVCSEHDAYVAALTAAGVEVDVLPPLEDFPDAVFVEDPAIVLPTGAILLRSKAPTRAGEAQALRAELEGRFARVVTLERGHADGGDVLVTPDAVVIGLSSRTDTEGAEALAARLSEFGLDSRIVRTPDDVLHLKSDCALLDDHTVLATTRLAASDVFTGLDVIEVVPGEETAANALRVNDVLFVAAQYARTRERLQAHGYRVVPLPTSAIERLDAGLSCLSLRWRDDGRPA